MKRIYVAGPFRGPDHWVIKQNINRAEELAAEVWKLGAVGVCPHKMCENFQGMLPDEVFIEGTLSLLEACHAMIVLPDWQRSDGTKGEIVFAQAHDIPIHHSLIELRQWLVEQAMRVPNGH